MSQITKSTFYELIKNDSVYAAWEGHGAEKFSDFLKFHSTDLSEEEIDEMPSPELWDRYAQHCIATEVMPEIFGGTVYFPL